MPTNDSKTPDSISQTQNWFADAPGGDISLDELFPNTEGSLSAKNDELSGTPASQPVQTAPPQAPAATTPEEFFLQVPTGTVYKSREEAIKGLSEKDSLIDTLRQKYIAVTHTDPISGKLVQAPAPQEQSVNYAQDSERFFDDAAEAVNSGDKKRWGAIFNQYIQDALGPFLPVVAESAKVRAQEVVSQELQDFRDVSQSPAYQKALDSLPGLRQAIETAQANPEYYAQLPELYRTAYFVTQGLRAAEIARTPVAPTQSTTPTRPTVQPTTLTPPLATNATQPSLATAEGRKAIIENAKQKGLDNLLFGNFKV